MPYDFDAKLERDTNKYLNSLDDQEIDIESEYIDEDTEYEDFKSNNKGEK